MTRNRPRVGLRLSRVSRQNVSGNIFQIQSFFEISFLVSPLRDHFFPFFSFFEIWIDYNPPVKWKRKFQKVFELFNRLRWVELTYLAYRSLERCFKIWFIRLWLLLLTRIHAMTACYFLWQRWQWLNRTREPGCKGEVRVEIGRKERNFLRGRHREIRARRSSSFRRLSTATPNSIFYRENIGVKYVHTLLLIHN